MSFGEILMNLRKERGMNQEELASKLNVSRQAVSKWESNNAYPETEKIIAICKLFDISVDELLGLKHQKLKKPNKLMSYFNEYCDAFIASINLFGKMTFKQKLICLIEMILYLGIIIFLITIFNIIFMDLILDNLLILLPYEISGLVESMIQGLLFGIYFILCIFMLIKLYKTRYLDCYQNYIKTIKEEPNINLDIPSISLKREEQIIIRDSDAISPAKFITHICHFFLRILCLLLALPVAFVFILICVLILFTLYYVKYGILLLYVALALLALLMICYVILEIIIKGVLNLKMNVKRIYVIIISGFLLLGISGGLFACEIASYRFVHDNYDFKFASKNLEMTDNLIIPFLNSYNTEIKVENREDIYIEYFTKEDLNLKLYDYLENIGADKDYLRYSYNGYKIFYKDYSINKIIDNYLSAINNKTIILYDSEPIEVKIYLNEENYKQLLKNEQQFYGYFDRNWDE